jgi:hypothetical protein
VQVLEISSVQFWNIRCPDSGLHFREKVEQALGEGEYSFVRNGLGRDSFALSE